MFKIIRRLKIIGQKKDLLEAVIMEKKCVEVMHKEDMEKDFSIERKQIASIRAIKNPSQKKRQEVVALEAKINEAEKWKSVIEKSEIKEKELRLVIKIMEMNLWS